MTPGARVQAAIDILDEIAAGRRPADEIVRDWGRAHRFAGAKDRRAIADLTYDVLRRRGYYALLTARDDARAAVLAHVAAGQGAGETARLFSGDGHAPAVLDADERQLAGNIATSARGVPEFDAPSFLLPELEAAFGADMEEELAALDRPAPLDLRVNTLKATREEARTRLAEDGIAAEPAPRSPIGLRIEGQVRIAGSAAFKAGLIEPMDEGSQLAALAVGAAPGMQVADLCAGAGGKALALAAEMENRGQIYASDADARRLGRLGPRMKRAGARNIQPVRWPQDGRFTDLTASCDRVLIDAPCSGTGAWRRHPELKWRLAAEDLAGLTRTQDALLRSAAPLVKPGGRIVYVTCSVLPAENEARTDAFLAEHPAFSRNDAASFRLTPFRDGTDGFYVAVLDRASAG